MSWEILWKSALILTLLAYSLLVVIVIFGGISNIIDMLRELRMPVQEHNDRE